MKINEKTKLAKVFEKKTLLTVLKKHNFPCVTCPLAKHEIEKHSVGYVCNIYGLSKKEILKELNEKAKRYK